MGDNRISMTQTRLAGKVLMKEPVDHIERPRCQSGRHRNRTTASPHLRHLAQAEDCLAAINAVMSEPNVGFTGPTCAP
jgi:hypothetical protein